jgi:hypothetical protein
MEPHARYASHLITTLGYVDFKTNKFSLNPEGDWYSIARADAGLLNAFLSTAAVFRNLHFGLGDLEAVVHHRYEAIRLVNQQLTNKPGSLCEELVTAVAVLVSAEVSPFSPIKSQPFNHAGQDARVKTVIP